MVQDSYLSHLDVTCQDTWLGHGTFDTSAVVANANVVAQVYFKKTALLTGSYVAKVALTVAAPVRVLAISLYTTFLHFQSH